MNGKDPDPAAHPLLRILLWVSYWRTFLMVPPTLFILDLLFTKTAATRRGYG